MADPLGAPARWTARGGPAVVRCNLPSPALGNTAEVNQGDICQLTETFHNKRAELFICVSIPGVGRHLLNPGASCSDQTASRADCQTQTRTAAHTASGSWV